MKAMAKDFGNAGPPAKTCGMQMAQEGVSRAASVAASVFGQMAPGRGMDQEQAKEVGGRE